MMAVIGTLGLNFHVLLPLLARESFGGGPESYSALVIAMGAGAVVGALVIGARERIGERWLVGSALAFGAFSLLATAAPSLGLLAAALVPLGAASVTFAAGVNSTLQLSAAPAMRGRVMALFSIVFMGSTPDRRADRRCDLRSVGRAGSARAGGRRPRWQPAPARPWPSAAFGEREVSSEPAAEAAASRSGSDRDRDPACERASRGGAPATARHGSERRRGPRSPEPQPRAGASRAR